MAYSNENKLKIIIFIQEYYIRKRGEDVKVKRIEKDMCERFFISRSTFYSYLNINAKAEMKKKNKTAPVIANRK